MLLHNNMSIDAALPALEYILWFLLECEVEKKKRVTAVISDVIRLQTITLGDFTLNLIFIVSPNGSCFRTVNKTAGDTPLIIDVNRLLLFAMAV